MRGIHGAKERRGGDVGAAGEEMSGVCINVQPKYTVWIQVSRKANNSTIMRV